MIYKKIDNMAYGAGKWPPDVDRPFLFFIHGAGMSSILWEHPVQSLCRPPENINTIAFDLPGHGQSPGAGKDRIQDYGDAVFGAIDGLGAQKAVLCGLSMGGAIVLDLLIRHPARFSGAILMGTGARLRVAPEIFQQLESDVKKFHDSFRSIAISPESDPACLDPVMPQLEKCPAPVIKNDFLACDRFDVLDRLEGIQVPVLAIFGEQDWLTPPKYGNYLAKNMKNTRVVQIPNAGHLALLEHPALVSRHMADFIGGL